MNDTNVENPTKTHKVCWYCEQLQPIEAFPQVTVWGEVRPGPFCSECVQMCTMLDIRLERKKDEFFHRVFLRFLVDQNKTEEVNLTDEEQEMLERVMQNSKNTDLDGEDGPGFPA